MTVLFSLCCCGCTGNGDKQLSSESDSTNDSSPPREDYSFDAGDESEGDGYPVEESGRAYLSSGDEEVPGYGLYSYLLFPSRPSDGSPQKERCLFAIEMWRVKIDALEDVEREYVPEKINVTYLPVRNERGFTSAEEIFQDYDFVRGKKLLNSFPESDPIDRDAIYLVSVRKPLSRGLTEPYLFIEVSTREKIVFEHWMGVFLDKVKHEERWNKTSLKEYALGLRELLDNVGVVASQVFLFYSDE
jgi:hypothetical protein